MTLQWVDVMRLGAFVAVLGLWIWLFRPVYGYLSVILTRDDFRTNQFLVLGVLVLAWTRLRASGILIAGRPQIHANAPALGMMLGGAIAFVTAEHIAQVHLLSAALFALSTYGFLGLWLTPERWRAGLPVALLLAGALPFGDVVDVLLGYPLRIATANLVNSGLAAAGVASLSVDTILVFENGVSQVDIPCSGVRGLWTGALFLIAATWLERRPLNGRWLLIASLFALALVAFNAVRVLALVVAGPLLGWRLFAEMLHVPLGVLGFAAACSVCVLLFRASPVAAPPARSPRTGAIVSTTQVAALVITLLLLNAVPPASANNSTHSPAPLALAFAPELAVATAPLADTELAWLARDGAESVERVRFTWRDRQGTMLLVQSRSWRAHHNPQRCFENAGLPVASERTHLAGDALPVRWLSLGSVSKPGTTAIYWFQSTTQTTDDYGARFWSSLSLQPEPWMLVTILFDKPVRVEQAGDVEALVATLHDIVQERLQALARTGGTR